MKDATGELNMTVIAIIVIAALGALAFWLLREGGPLEGAIETLFTNTVEQGGGDLGR